MHTTSSALALIDPPFSVAAPPRQTAAVVFASPHSGKVYLPEFVAASQLDPLTLRRSEDAFVDDLLNSAPDHGAPLIRALFPRAYVDPNREPWELDPAMFEDALPPFVNAASPRVGAGLGTIARVVASGAEIYRGKLHFADARTRVEKLYRPYHAKLTELVEATRQRFGRSLLIDCHSMPSVGGPMDRDPGRRRVDFVLGDCFGAACAPVVTDTVERVLKAQGYAVGRNAPYAGGFTTRDYGRPKTGRHALQIEINRGLYMDEERIEKSAGFAALKRNLDQLIRAAASLSAELPACSNSAPVLVRESGDGDMAQIHAIYSHHVEHGLGSFEETAPTLEEMTRRRRDILARLLPYLVAERDGRIMGYSYAGPYRTRSAYRYTLENSVYVAPDAHRLGVGRALLDELIARCTALGYRQMVAVIGDSANSGSIRLHEAAGFTRAAHLTAIGFKFGRWVDSILMQRPLGEGDKTSPEK